MHTLRGCNPQVYLLATSAPTLTLTASCTCVCAFSGFNPQAVAGTTCDLGHGLESFSAQTPESVGAAATDSVRSPRRGSRNDTELLALRDRSSLPLQATPHPPRAHVLQGCAILGCILLILTVSYGIRLQLRSCVLRILTVSQLLRDCYVIAK